MVIISSNKPQVNTWIAAGMVLLNISLNLFLIPTLGIVGAGWSTFVTEVFGLIIGIIYINKFYGQIRLLGFLVKPAIASVVLSVAILLSGANFYLIPAYILVYFIVLVLIGGVDSEDQILLKKALFQRRALVVGEEKA
jgi:O-antigen/teichoic acid export membrane protein